jgi:hypothetical protein
MMRRLLARARLGAAALLLAAPLMAQTAPAAIDYTAERAAIGRFQDADQRLQDVGWQLARGNVGFCPKVVASIGLQLQDMASYGAPQIARTALGLTQDFAVQTAARFWERWGKKHDAGLLMVRNHDGWDERVEFVSAEVPLVTGLMAREGRADWRVHFRREITPEGGLAPRPKR